VLEKELKYRLSQEAYSRLRRALKRETKSIQKSATYYFDHPKQTLRKKGIGLRIRIVENRKAILTLKLPAPISPNRGPRAYRVRREYECSLPLSRAKAALREKGGMAKLAYPPLRILRREIGQGEVSALRLIGRMSMVRAKAIVESFFLEVDRFRCFGKAFYELEIETDQPDRADQMVRKLFRRLEIPYVPSSLSKLGRFLKEWKAQ
jgi:uncharacterized protein YjbK